MALPEELDLVVQNQCPPPHRGRVVLYTLGTLFIAGLLLVGFVASYNYVYSDRVYPGVHVGTYDLGGMTASEVKNLVETVNNRYAKEGVRLIFKTEQNRVEQVTLPLISGGDVSAEAAILDSDALATMAITAGRGSGNWGSFWQPVLIRYVHPVTIEAQVITQDPVLSDSIHSALGPFEDRGANAELSFIKGTYFPQITPEKEGFAFSEMAVKDAVVSAMQQLSFSPVHVELNKFIPAITRHDVQAALPKLNQVLSDISLNYVNNETKAREEWVLNPDQIRNMLTVVKDADNTTIFSLQENRMKKFIESSIAPTINVEPAEAKFTIADLNSVKVQEFQPSKTGIKVDVDETFAQLRSVFESRNYTVEPTIKTVTVVVKIVEPLVKTADINSLGITEVVGVGTSTFKDSHTNRIKNIANAVKRLNGLLIKPGEVFSANKAAGPFTSENGFLPEAVIKGDKITKEIGGGMCQIGTTLFRMAMQSGMPITERHNHSLVVSYYADPVNHNPGTDASLYEPLLDFKFVNDTGNYLLLLTDIDYKKQMLTFTLWGKSDGRSGSYSRPVVKKWIPAGEAKHVYVDNPAEVKPGETKCQAAFTGAVATFTYTRFTSTTQKFEQVFDSYYRPLPKICLTGVPAGSCVGKKVCTPPESFAATSTPSTF